MATTLEIENLPVFRNDDLSELLELERETEPGLITSLAEQFAETAVQIRSEIEVSLKNLDKKRLERAYHSLKSSAAALGGQQLAGICQILEELAESANFEACSSEQKNLNLKLDSYLNATSHLRGSK